ncbi:unnamed protein product [Calypogeia fissa]
MKKGLVKFVGEVGMKKIAYLDNKEPIPFNNNKGGMKALAKRWAGRRSVEASTSHVEAIVFHLEAKELEARACSKCEVEMLGIEGPMRAFLDSNSKVNLMSKEVYEEGGWMIDKDIDWKVDSMNSTGNPLFGACPNVRVKFGNVVEPQKIFMKAKALPYLVILEQPFIVELRMKMKVLDDGTHMAKVWSQDGLKVVQFLTMLPNHGRNRRDLKMEPKKNERSSGNCLVLL